MLISLFNNKMYNINILCTEVALKTLFAGEKGVVSYTIAVLSLDSINSKIITADILFLLLQLIESFPTNIVHYIGSIMVNIDVFSSIITQLYWLNFFYEYSIDIDDQILNLIYLNTTLCSSYNKIYVLITN